jgi:hypothetical protein
MAPIENIYVILSSLIVDINAENSLTASLNCSRNLAEMEPNKVIETMINWALLGYFQNSNTHNLRGSATCLLHGATGLY